MIEIRVYGLPAPQGSKKLVGRDRQGRGILVESSKKVKPWREAVRWAFIEQAHGQHVPGPVIVQMIFTLPKPKSAPKRRQTYPDKAPDLSKIVRATEDALTEVHAWEDDARIVDEITAKRYPGEGPGALETPGAVIRIWPIREIGGIR